MVDSGIAALRKCDMPWPLANLLQDDLCMGSRTWPGSNLQALERRTSFDRIAVDWPEVGSGSQLSYGGWRGVGKPK